jgi:RNA polymerase sigma factor (sigma-70 family)
MATALEVMKALPHQTSAPTTTGENFNELVHRYQDAAFAYAYAILKDRSAAEDATQTAFLTAWIHLSSLRDLAAFGAWLRKIVKTECLRIVRTDRLRTVPLGDTLVEPPIHEASVEVRLALLEAIAALREKDRVAISLRYLSDLSYQEMADFLLEPVSTVKKRLHGARRRLRVGLESLTAQNVREWRPSTHARLEDRIVALTAFLETVARGELADVETALDAHPEFLTAHGGLPRYAVVSADALSLAAMCGREDVVKLLLARGTDRKSVSAAGVSPIAIAAVEGRQQIVQLLVNNGFDTDIFAAAALGDVNKVRALLADNPALADATTPDGKTPLHFARSVPVATVLLEAGMSVDPPDAFDQTPVQWIAATGRHKEVCACLRAHGAKTESADAFWACVYGDRAAVEQFVTADPALLHARRPAGPGVPTPSIGSTLLHIAASHGENEIARFLIARGADVDARGEHAEGGSPLHAAAAGGHHEMVEILVAAGANVAARDGQFGVTADEWARFFGHVELFERLKDLKTHRLALHRG